MNKEIFLKNKYSKRASNVSNELTLEMLADQKILPIDDMSVAVNAYDEYIKEKDASTKYRLIFTINPICSNILFNPLTEVLYGEGSDECEVIMPGSPIPSSAQAYNEYKKSGVINPIEDTGYSHPKAGALIYHCGVDIFNNHTLRRKEFATVNKLNETEEGRYFNTLSDYMRKANGDIVKEKLLKEKADGILNNDIETPLHLYRYDSVRTFPESVRDNLIESDGWVGFLNPSSLNIDNCEINGEAISINKCMNERKAGEQIDMYPDRTLYSFIPKVNKARRRVEKNWDYCITYPAVKETENSLVKGGISCRILSGVDGTILNGSGTNEYGTVFLKTQITNTFQPNDLVVIYLYRRNGEVKHSLNPAKIKNVGFHGEDTAHIFSVDISSLYEVLGQFGNDGISIESCKIKVKKYIKGTECEYYIRKFKKLGDFKNDLNKLAFSENIFTDDIAQIVYTEDIDIAGKTDYLGRAISELYLTIIKRNAGNEEWANGEYNSPKVEFSHCFGSNAAGFDLSSDKEDEEYNVHKIHGNYSKPAALESGIAIKDDDEQEFYGDIVEYSPYEIKETVIEPVYFRFNTIEREKEVTIPFNEIEYDDYDIEGSFGLSDKEWQCTPAYEGYYYQPHYKVLLRQFNETVHQGNHKRVVCTHSGGTVYVAAKDYALNIGDVMHVYKDGNTRSVMVNGVTGLTFSISEECEDDSIFFKADKAKPSYAYDLNDGTGRYLWREPLSDRDLLMGDELYNSVFTNGAHYRHKIINFYLRRQDPYGEYGLNNGITIDYYTGASEGKITDISIPEIVNETESKIC